MSDLLIAAGVPLLLIGFALGYAVRSWQSRRRRRRYYQQSAPLIFGTGFEQNAPLVPELPEDASAQEARRQPPIKRVK
jgi:hypothetical protein